jgi:tetratricopeptide (TPR) repeat protein/transcriptional regulator with XRE-family HTH domain
VLLRQLREAAGLTQEELADAARMSPRSVSDLERGISRTPRTETVRRLAAALALDETALARFRAVAAGRQPGVGEAMPTGPADPGLAAVRALPRDVAGFTGRAAELGQLTRSVADAPSLSVVGICAIGGLAGIGKTSLALHAAHLLAERFPDGQLFVPLHAHTPGRRPVDPADALASLLRVAGYAGHIPDDLDGRAACWRAFLAGKKVLVVLDDAAEDEQAGPLLPGSPGSLVLITSRQRLAGLTDAAVISLDTLPPADAARLLAVTAGRPGLAADDPAVAQVIGLCGSLPLAIAMAGSQLRHHPAWPAGHLAELLVGARDRPGLLSAGNLSVAAAFDLSYRDLRTAQRRLFRALGIHPGGDFDAYAAAALADTNVAAADRALTALYDQHLITEHVPGRYRMHDLLREHARTLAAHDDPASTAATITRLLDYYTYTVQGASKHWPPWFSAKYDFSPDQTPAGWPSVSTREGASAWFGDELANLVAAAGEAAASGKPSYALAISVATHGYMESHGARDHSQPFARLHDTILESALREGDSAALAFAYLLLAGALASIWQTDAAVASAKKALPLFRELGDMPGQCDALRLTGIVCAATSDFAAAEDYLGRVLELVGAMCDRREEARALVDLGALKGFRGDYNGAVAMLEQGLAIYREFAVLRREPHTLGYLASVWMVTGKYPAARTALERAQAIQRDLGDPGGTAQFLVPLAAYHRLTGELPAAFASIQQAMDEFDDTENPAKANARNELGLAQQLTGDYEAAATNHQAALQQFRVVGNRMAQTQTLNNLGELSLRAADTGQAAAHHVQALALARTIGHPLEEARALEGLGRSDLRAGLTSDAAARLEQALAIYQRLGAVRATDVGAVLDSIETADGSTASVTLGY